MSPAACKPPGCCEDRAAGRGRCGASSPTIRPGLNGLPRDSSGSRSTRQPGFPQINCTRCSTATCRNRCCDRQCEERRKKPGARSQEPEGRDENAHCYWLLASGYWFLLLAV